MIFVSIIIPCRNEEKFIGKCLETLISQDYCKDKMEIIIADGMSEDKTREIINSYIKNYSFIKVLDNPKKTTPFGLNIAIQESKGSIIIRMDAHAIYQKDYVSKCVKYLEKYKVDNVGGTMGTLPANDTLTAKAISFSLSSPFGVGNAYFRIGSKEPREVDTVFGGCYRKKIFEKIGYFDENLARGQDMELNLRLKKSGGKILLIPEIKSFYFSRPDFKSFWHHSFMDGTKLIYPLKFGIVIFSWRHLIPFVFVLILISLGFLAALASKFLPLFIWFIGLYLLINIYFSTKISFLKKDFRYLYLMPISFIVLHIGYGLGSVDGFLKVLFSTDFWKSLKKTLNKK